MSDARCPHCNADIKPHLTARVFDGSRLSFTHTCDCGAVLTITVEVQIEFDIKTQEAENVRRN